MNRLSCLPGVIVFVGLCAFNTPATAADMTFQLINDTERPLNLKMFSRAESLQQWPSKSTAFSVRPDAAVQQVKINCEEREQVCWGAWETVQNVSGEVHAGGRRATRTVKYSAGAGERGLRSCTRCCHVCKDGALTPIAKLRDPDPMAK